MRTDSIQPRVNRPIEENAARNQKVYELSLTGKYSKMEIALNTEVVKLSGGRVLTPTRIAQIIARQAEKGGVN